MKAKHIIAIIAVLALGATLFAGCELNNAVRTPNYIPTPTLPLGVDSLDGLTDAQRQALINEWNLDPATMELPMPAHLAQYAVPDTTEPGATTMPAGVATLASEVYPLLRNTFDILGSDRFYLRGRSTNPATELAPASNNTPVAFARDGQRTVLENQLNWNDALAGGGPNHFNENRVQAAFFNATFGSQMRMIIDPAGPIIAFPARNTFLSIAEMIDFAGGDLPEMDMGNLDVMSLGILEIPDDLQATRVTVGGR